VNRFLNFTWLQGGLISVTVYTTGLLETWLTIVLRRENWRLYVPSEETSAAFGVLEC